MRDLLHDLVRQFEALENGPSQPADWTTFVERAQSVYERSLILRYKSLERMQAEEPAEPIEESVEPPVMVWTPQPVHEAPEAAAPAPEEIEVPAQEAPTEVAPHAEEPPAETTRSPSAQPVAGEGVSLAEKLSLQPLKSILPSLGINDRVRFAGALFGGNMQQLQTACAAVEEATDFESAMERVQALAATGLDWNDEDDAPHQFMQLVQRVHL